MKQRFIVLIVWTLILLGLLLIPSADELIPRTCGGFEHWDKVAHFGLFGVTGLVGVFGTSFLRQFKSRILFGIAFGLFLAVSTEFAQSLIPARNMSLYDLLADVAGLCVAFALCVLLYRRPLFARLFSL
ncbi:VanZ family protein [Chloroflexota bacterium]